MVGFGPADLGSNPSRATSKQAPCARFVNAFKPDGRFLRINRSEEEEEREEADEQQNQEHNPNGED